MPISKFFELPRLARLPNWMRWLFVVPFAFALSIVAEMLPRWLFVAYEVIINHELLYRPGFLEIVWQWWSPLFFVAGAVQMAPRFKFEVFLVFGGIKALVAAANLVEVIRFVRAGGPWNALDEVTKAPLWWDGVVYVACLATLIVWGVYEMKWRTERGTTAIAATQTTAQ